MAIEELIVQERDHLVARLTFVLGGDRDTAEELVQESLFRAWRQLPADMTADQQKGWLARTAKNLALDELRRRARRPISPLEDISALHDVTGEDDLQADAASDALAQLSAHERFVLLLRFNGGFSHAEVARLLDITEEAARKRVTRARTAFLHAYRCSQGDSDPLILLILRGDPPEPYVRWLQQGGARVRQSRRRPTERELMLADGVVFTGGFSDLYAGLYGEQQRHVQGDPDPTSDSANLAVMKGALALDLPTVGVCSGGQLLNLASGGTLYQDVIGDGLTRVGHVSDHRVHTTQGGIARQLFGASAEVSSFHHQAVRQVGRRLRVAATSPDGVIESIERVDRRFALGVQWHPEVDHEGPGTRLAEALVRAARQRVA